MLAGFEHLNSYHGDMLLNYIDNIGQHRGEMDQVIGNPPYGDKILQAATYGLIKNKEEQD